jgi:uncharacterized membrane protein
MFMSKLRYLWIYVVCFLTFCLLDFAWLAWAASNFYRPQLGSMMLAEPKLLPAFIFYLLYICGLMVFAVLPGIHARSWRTAAMRGGFLGLVAYGTYDLSNWATLQGWSGEVVAVDMMWGMVGSSLAALAAFFSAGQVARSK